MKKQKQKNKSGNSVMQVIVFITAILFVGALLIIMLSDGKNSEKREEISLTDQPILGDVDAPVSIVEFGDFMCPSCGAWTSEIFPKLNSKYIENGKASLSFINVLFHGESSYLGSIAAEAVLSLYPKDYWDFHHELYAQQPKENHDAPWLTEETIIKVAEDTITDFNLEDFSEEINKESSKKQVEIDANLVEKHKVESTPTVYINGIKLANPMDIKAIEKAIEKELGKK